VIYYKNAGMIRGMWGQVNNFMPEADKKKPGIAPDTAHAIYKISALDLPGYGGRDYKQNDNKQKDDKHQECVNRIDNLQKLDEYLHLVRLIAIAGEFLVQVDAGDYPGFFFTLCKNNSDMLAVLKRNAFERIGRAGAIIQIRLRIIYFSIY
jgi:hypothetical protein